MEKKLKIIRVTTKPISLNILLKGQLKYINKFHDIIAISSSGKELKDFETEEGIRTIPLEMTRKISPIKDFISLLQMIRILKIERPDIVHSHTPKAGVISMVAAFICKIPHRLHTVAGLPLMEARGFKKKFLLLIEWLTYFCATKIYPNSFGLKKYITKNISIPKNKIIVLGSGSTNGIDTSYFDITPEIKKSAIYFKNKYQLDGMFTFIFIGRIVRDKGIEELTNAFTKINKKHKNARLLILGWEEDDLDPISKKTKEILKLNNDIKNLGFKKDIRPFLAASDCLVLPSYREGFPNVVLQAGCMQVPSIVSDINGCNEIIRNNINGLIVEPKNVTSLFFAMEKMLTKREMYISFTKSARKNIVKNFNRDDFYKEILSNYSNLEKKNVY